MNMHQCRGLLKTVIIAFFFLATNTLAQDPWQGSWNTNQGNIKLYSVGNYVLGDYGGAGIILGEKKFDLLQGVFTNPTAKRSGHFTFQSLPGNQFRGSYSWTPGGQLTDWTGNRTSTEAPTLQNFAFPKKALKPIPNTRKVYDGVYSSPHGQLRLRMQDNLLFGDYDNKGILAGQWDGNHFSGHFSNQGKLGWFKFYFNSADGSFAKGEWGWFPRETSAPWALSKVSAGTPPLSQIALVSNSQSGKINVDTKTNTNTNTNTTNNNSNSNTNKQQTTATSKASMALSPVRSFDLALASTALGMQEHVQWISQANEADVLRTLREHGYTVVGNTLITSEVDDPVIAKLTTERLRSYVAVKGNDVVVCFRGSKAATGMETALNGLTDLNASLEKPLFFFPQSAGYAQAQELKIHKGFHRAYIRLRGRIIASVERAAGEGKTLYIFGHSLGGAQATLCALDAGTNLKGKFRSINLIISGAPRVGDVRFSQFFSTHVSNAVRIEVKNDRITMVPPMMGPQALYRFMHVGKLIALTRQGDLIPPAQIKKNPAAADLGAHGNPVYYQAVKAFYQKAQTAGFFNGKQSYMTEAGREERN